jgi:hypothetical protein
MLIASDSIPAAMADAAAANGGADVSDEGAARPARVVELWKVVTYSPYAT